MKNKYKIAIPIIVLTFALFAVISSASADGGNKVINSACTDTPPTIDGVITPGEWSGKHTLTYTFHDGSGGIPVTLYVMNDEENLYIAATYADSTNDINDIVGFAFDYGNDGILKDGDEDGMAVGPPGFVDGYYNASAFSFYCADVDTNSSDGGGARNWNNGIWTFERLSNNPKLEEKERKIGL